VQLGHALHRDARERRVEDEARVRGVVVRQEDDGALRVRVAGLGHDVVGRPVRQRAAAEPEPTAGDVVVDGGRGQPAHQRGGPPAARRGRQGGGVEQPQRPPVAAVRPLLLHPHVAAARGAQLAGEPLGRAPLPVGGRRALVGGQLAHDALDQRTHGGSAA